MGKERIDTDTQQKHPRVGPGGPRREFVEGLEKDLFGTMRALQRYKDVKEEIAAEKESSKIA